MHKYFRQLRGLSDDTSRDRKKKWTDVWGDYIATQQNLDSSRAFQVRNYPQYTDGANLYSGPDNVSVFYYIENYPKSLQKDFKRDARSKIPSGSNIKISFIENFQDTSIDWSNKRTNARLSTYRIIEEENDEGDAYNRAHHIQATNQTEWVKESVEYLADATIMRKRQLFITRITMIISGERGEIFDKTVRQVVNLLAGSYNLTLTRITENLEDYMNVISPFSLSYKNDIYKNMGNSTIPDEILGQFFDYSQGKVGYDGLYWGTDIHSGFPVFKKLKRKGTEAENILVTAKTGAGKSFWIKGLLFQLYQDDNFNGTIMDYEGDEYKPFVDFLIESGEPASRIITLNMGEGSGAYFDPVPILNVFEDSSRDFKDMVLEQNDDNQSNNPYYMAKSYSASIMRVLCGQEGATNALIGKIINDAIENMYRRAGVTENPRTWERSLDLRLENIYDELINLEYDRRSYVEKDKRGELLTPTESIMIAEDYTKTLQFIILMCSDYFGENAARSQIFRTPISLQEVIKAKIVVCSFGMQGRPPEVLGYVQMSLMEIFAANISQIRSIYSKREGKNNWKLWEEFQRWSAFKGSENMIKVALTGGRKLGDVNFILTNNLEDLLQEGGDKFALLPSITSAVVGALNGTDTIHTFCTKYNLLDYEDDLNKIMSENKNASLMNTAKTNKVNEFKSIYDHAFLLYLDGEVAVAGRMVLPDCLAERKIFQTGTKKYAADQKKGL